MSDKLALALGYAVRHNTDPPPGFAVALCAKRRTLERRAMAAFWELAEARAVPALPPTKRRRTKR